MEAAVSASRCPRRELASELRVGHQRQGLRLTSGERANIELLTITAACRSEPLGDLNLDDDVLGLTVPIVAHN